MTVQEAERALETALSMPIRPPDEAGNHLRDYAARGKAVRAARAALHVAIDERDQLTTTRPTVGWRLCRNL